MEWNVKWDWENLVAFGSKAIENENEKLQLADNWAMVDDGSFNLPANSASSAKTTSLSASTDSSCKDGTGTGTGTGTHSSSIFKLTTSEEKGSFKLSGTSSSAEALLGLKLGKRTYFENSAAAAEIGVVPAPPAPKKTKSSSSSQINSPIFCQVEGCNVDLSLAKEYHRKHRVCDSHSKCPKVVVGGRERRFCQQCSKFHSLSEFDEKKRSCRRRLSDHNARRRKPQQETIQFSSPWLSTPFYGIERPQQMSFLLDNSPLVYSRIPVNSNSKFTLAKGDFNGDGGCDEQLHMPGTRVPQAINMQNAANGLSASKNTLTPGSKGSSASSLDAAPEYRRALSLLSSNSCNQESIQLHLHRQLHDNGPNIIQPTYHSIPQGEGVPFSSSELWPTGPHPVNHHHVQPLASFKTPYDGDFCSNLLN